MDGDRPFISLFIFNILYFYSVEMLISELLQQLECAHHGVSQQGWDNTSLSIEGIRKPCRFYYFEEN